MNYMTLYHQNISFVYLNQDNMVKAHNPEAANGHVSDELLKACCQMLLAVMKMLWRVARNGPSLHCGCSGP